MSSNVQTKFSFVIPTCNRPGDLEKCLNLLRPQWAEEGKVEVLVCDDSKDTVTKEMVESKFPEVRWNQGPRKGPASNRNSGAKIAQGEWLIFIDDDCLPRPTLLSAYRKKTEELTPGNKVALEGPTFRIGDPDSLLWEAPHTPNGGVLISCNFAIPRQLFWEVGGFDERFPHAAFEDTEFAVRAGLLGMKIDFVQEAAVDHPLRPLPQSNKLANRWESRVISSYDFGAKPWQVMWFLPRHVFMVILSRFRGQPRSAANLKAASIFAGEFFIFARKLPAWCRRHKRTPRSVFWNDPARASDIPRRFGL